MDELEELRDLLLRREQEQIREIQERLEDKERRVRETAGALPLAVKVSRERGEDFNRAIQPSVESAIQVSLEERPQVFVEALLPHIGLLVRRSIAESLRGLVQSINKTMEHTFSVQGLKWRYEALRTGRSFAEVVMLHSMVYRVEDVFLIHGQTSLTLLHVTAEDTEDRDSDLVAGMLSAIRDFARDAMKAGAEDVLDEFRIGELEGWIATGRHAYLAAAIRGTPPRELRGMLDETIDNIHILKGNELAKFDGDASVFEPLRPDLEACLRVQYRQESASASGERRSNNAKAIFAISLAVTTVIFAAFLIILAKTRWNDFQRRLGAEPGIVVTAARRGWIGESRVTGLRDPLAADPAALAQAANVNPKSVRFDWKPYYALDPVSIRRRFEQRFPPPAGAKIGVSEGGAMSLAGSVPYEWLERVRREGAQTPGVSAIAEQPGLKTTFDPALALARFRQAFPLPAGIEARVKDGTLALSGSAPYEWIAPVREGAAKLPGIQRIDETALQVAFDPALVLRRFEGKFSVPDTVSASVQADGTLTLTGEASHRWLERVRQQAADAVPGIQSVDVRGVTDLDLQAFQQSKSVIESAFIYFLPNKDNFATEGFAALSRLPDEIRQCETAAKRIGGTISVAVIGSADGMGPEAKNMELSQRRAKAVTDFLVSCMLDADLFKPTGLGAPPMPSPSPIANAAAPGPPKPAAEQSQRRVAFRVDVSLSSSPR